MPSQSGRSLVQNLGLFSGALVSLSILFFCDFAPGRPEVTKMAAVASLMAIWWVTEALPLFVTALFPIALYPILGIMKSKVVAPVYTNSMIFLFLGGFLIAAAMQRHNLHKRIAFSILRVIGGGPNRIILGFMSASAFTSMWISNTATAMMMVPIGLAIIFQMEKRFGKEKSKKFALSLILSIAYACSMGGIATLVGTPPNAIMAQVFEITFPEAPAIGFGQWMLAMAPISVIMVLLIWVLLTRVFFRSPSELKIDESVIREEYNKLGAMNFEQKSVMTVFVMTGLLWVFRKKLDLGVFSIPGWSQLIPHSAFFDDGTVATGMALILFFIPARSAGGTILNTEVFKKLPWDIFFLFGGGFALAKGFQVTGLSAMIGEQFSGLSGLNPFLMLALVCISLSFLSEFTSNTATTQLILPILASICVGLKINPMFLMIPATVAASCVFSMPVATPPNAIVFGSGRIKIGHMARAGVFLDFTAMIMVSVIFYFWGSMVFNISPTDFPAWAR